MMTAASTVLRGVAGAQLGILVSMLLLAATPAQGTPIHLVSATHTATVTLEVREQDAETETMTSTNTGVSASLFQEQLCDDPNFENCSTMGWGYASAGISLFFAHTYSEAYDDVEALAHTEGEWTFSPVANGIAPIFMSGHIESFSGTSVTLFDVTANSQLWTFVEAGALFHDIPTFLDAGHVYRMRLDLFTGGPDARMGMAVIHVRGLEPVPDNVDSFMCLCVGLLVALLGTWKLRA